MTLQRGFLQGKGSTLMWRETPEGLLIKFYIAWPNSGMLDHQGRKGHNKILHSTKHYRTKFNQLQVKISKEIKLNTH